jgi:hypothetical protein
MDEDKVVIIARCAACGEHYTKRSVIGDKHRECPGERWIERLLAKAA